jgi:hypothetical protein
MPPAKARQVLVFTRLFVGQPTDMWSFLGFLQSTKQVRCLQGMRPSNAVFFGAVGIASEFFSLTHHNRWQYTSCNIPSKSGPIPALAPNCWEAIENGCKEDPY